MKSFFLSVLAMVISLISTSVYLAILSNLPFIKNFIYIYLMILVYGWPVYVSAIFIHRLLANRIKVYSIWIDTILGVLVFAVISFVIIYGEFTEFVFQPSTTHYKLHEIASFGLGGIAYGLLYNSWIARPKNSE